MGGFAYAYSTVRRIHIVLYVPEDVIVRTAYDDTYRVFRFFPGVHGGGATGITASLYYHLATATFLNHSHYHIHIYIYTHTKRCCWAHPRKRTSRFGYTTTTSIFIGHRPRQSCGDLPLPIWPKRLPNCKNRQPIPFRIVAWRRGSSRVPGDFSTWIPCNNSKNNKRKKPRSRSNTDNKQQQQQQQHPTHKLPR